MNSSMRESSDEKILDDYTEYDFNENDVELDSPKQSKKRSRKKTDSWRKVEAFMAERDLARETQEYNFDIH